MIFAVGLVLALVVALPHAVRLERSPPIAGATVWMSALLLRALISAVAALYVFVALPTNELLDGVTHWCWHTVLPVVATDVGVHGHSFAAVASLLPASLIAASSISICVGLWSATRAVGRLVQRAGVGEGPRNSVIVGDGDVLVAAAGLRRPRVVISAGALMSLDDEELEASLEHEAGHVAHRHRYVLIVAELCRALGRFLPGTAVAARELTIHLERDADHFAMKRLHAPVALASAICKAAQRPTHMPVIALGGGGVTRRVHELLDAECDGSHPRGSSVRLLAGAMAAFVLALSIAVLSATLAAANSEPSSFVRHCVD